MIYLDLISGLFGFFFQPEQYFLSQQFSQNSIFQLVSAKFQTSERGPIIHELVPGVSAPPLQANSIEIRVENPNVQINEPQQDETIV